MMMMGLDYWNHPLVIKAVRAKYRGNGLKVSVNLYFLLLVASLAAVYRFGGQFGGQAWINYLIAMISLQLLISAVIAMSATSNSMQSEVTTRTLDFQRIASLTPNQLLVGKAIGEPASAYLLILVAMPIVAISCALGGVDYFVAALLYLSLITSTFMMASLGLQHSLEPTGQAGRRASGIVLAVFMIICFSPVLMLSRRVSSLSAILGLLTPIPTIQSVLASQNPSGLSGWSAGLPLFGTKIPFLVLTPLSQVAASACALRVMSRRMKHNLDSPISKPAGYCFLALLDMLFAGLHFDTIQDGPSLTNHAIMFAIAHSVFSLVLIGLVTPSRESYQSWIWRFRGRRSMTADLLIGERTLNLAVVAIYCGVGVLIYSVSTLLPVAVRTPELLPNVHWPALIIASIVSIMLIACYGLFYQVIRVAAGKTGAGMVFLLLSLVAMTAPFALGGYLNIPMISSLSPIATFVRLSANPGRYYSPTAFIVAHTLVIAFWMWGLNGISRRLTRQVDRKLAVMHEREPQTSTARGDT